jgi:pimeloyl-ACP methyl ester carboxylesterase
VGSETSDGGTVVETLLNFLFGTALALVAIVASGYFWQWFYIRPTGQDETLYLTTKDGWKLAVHHYVPHDGSVGSPVILCHGLSSNRFSFDLPGCPSLAEYLRALGRDVWVPELRGSGMGDVPGLFFSDVPYSWDFDDHLRNDVPAIIDLVLERSAATKAHWIGHSMGGLLILAYLAGHDEPRVASAVTMGSPVGFSHVRNGNFNFLLKLKWLIAKFPIFPLPFVGRLVTPFARWLSKYLLGAFYAPNLTPQTARKVIALAAELVTSNKIWLTFGRFVETGRFADPAGRLYLTNLPNTQVPILFTGGTKDMMAPELAVLAACDPTADHSGKRECLIFGKASGCVEDYGHMDLLVGERVEQEVFPVILKALQEHDDH